MRRKINLELVNNVRKNFVGVILVVFVIFTFVIISGNSFATPIDDIKTLSLYLYDNNDRDSFEKELYNYIDIVDDSLIVNSSFNISDKLNENYDFLTSFAISFILDNEEYYDILVEDEYVYRDLYGNEFTTNKYINVDKIYEITEQVFGVEYYYILNDYINIDGDMIPLLRLEKRDFDVVIDDILNIDRYDEYIDVIVRYVDNELEYVYRFEYMDNRLVIGDLIVREQNMKRVFIVLLLLIDIVVMILYFNFNKRYINVMGDLSNNLDGSSYEDMIGYLNNEYNDIVDKIDNIVSYDIDRDNFKYEDIVLKLDNDYDELVVVNSDLSKKVEGLSKQKVTLTNTYNKIMEEQIMKSTFIIDGISKINQYSQGYPTGCESAALTILLR